MHTQTIRTQAAKSRTVLFKQSLAVCVVLPLVLGLSGCSSLNFFSKSKAQPVAVAPAAPSTSNAAEKARSLAQEEANRALVLQFYEQFFNQHAVDLASALIVDEYVQHNPFVPNGKAAFVEYFRGYFKEFPDSRAQVVRSATDGDLVYLHVHSTSGPGNRGEAVVDIFRIDDGRIVEHWDVIQEVPEHPVNASTMF